MDGWTRLGEPTTWTGPDQMGGQAGRQAGGLTHVTDGQG